MIDTRTWRPTNWQRRVAELKETPVTWGGSKAPDKEKSIIEATATAVLEDYLVSPEFADDAKEFCRNQGWMEPNIKYPAGTDKK